MARLVHATSEDEEQRLFSYRLGRFLDLGFMPADAELLAVSEADWRQVEDMLNQGCCHQLALEIVL